MLRSFWRAAALGLLAVHCGLTPDSASMGQSLPVHQARQEPEVVSTDSINVAVSHDATGELGKVQQEIAAQIARQALCPEERRAAFPWINKKSADGFAPRLWGWWGVIENTKKTSDGWLVKLWVGPSFGALHAVPRPGDHYIEVYHYYAGKAVFLEAIVPPNGTEPAVFTWN